jgi:hypothetical protein
MVTAPFVGAAMDSTRSPVSFSAMSAPTSVIRQCPGRVSRCGTMRVFAVCCKRFRLIYKGFSPDFGISRQYQGLGGTGF